jgi:DNA repair protein RadD
MLVPRPYQELMISTAMQTMLRKSSCLIQAATGAGKTVVFAELIRRWINAYPSMRILVLVHREIIVKQNAGKLWEIWPDAPIGIACASAQRKVQVDQPVVFASVQTLASRISTMPMFHLVIVDEAHRMTPKGLPSQYKTIIEQLRIYYPTLRIFGLTATPYRLNWGPIYGSNHKRKDDKSPSANWFDELDLSIGMKQLQETEPDDDNPDAPYLCPMRVFVEDKSIEVELRGISTVAGEYNAGQLSGLMKNSLHVASALDAYKKHREGRFRCVVFAVSIEHAERLKEVFLADSIPCEVVHSDQEKEHNRDILKAFDAGKIPVVVNVGVMTEGWDCRSVDMLLMARPTKSAALFVQIVGRGLRTFPGKQDVLIIDLAGNFNRHGPPWEPILPSYEKAGSRPKEQEKKPEKECDKCGTPNPTGSWVCSECGNVLRVRQIEEARPVKLRELELAKMARKKGERAGQIESLGFSKHVTKLTGAICLRVTAYLTGGSSAVHFFRVDKPYYLGKMWLNLHAPFPIPKTIEALLDAHKKIPQPYPFVTLSKDDRGYWKVNEWK